MTFFIKFLLATALVTVAIGAVYEWQPTVQVTSKSKPVIYEVNKTYCIEFTLRKFIHLPLYKRMDHLQMIDLYDEFGKARIC